MPCRDLLYACGDLVSRVETASDAAEPLGRGVKKVLEPPPKKTRRPHESRNYLRRTTSVGC